jgi:hypothetical protein
LVVAGEECWAVLVEGAAAEEECVAEAGVAAAGVAAVVQEEAAVELAAAVRGRLFLPDESIRAWRTWEIANADSR